jgi:dTDP-4-amino-4,6-dideoxygalactose transaminase
VFVDIDPETFNLDPDALEQAITSKTRAIVPADLFGQCAAMEAIMGIAELHGIPVIEDAAQSLGAEHAGRRAGSMAHFTTFSFYPSKNLGGFGDGGMLTTLDTEADAKLRSLRVHGESERYVHSMVGVNSRLDALQAAVLRVKLRHLDDWTEKRRRHAAEYTRLLNEAGLVRDVQLPRIAADSSRHVFNQYTIRVQERDALRRHLQECGVSTAVYYPVPLHRQPCFQELSGTQSLPRSERAAAEVLSLPLYPELSAAQRSYVVECLAGFYKARR